MKKNVASQKVGAQLVSATDGSNFTGAVTVYVTGDAGTQAVGSVSSGACTHEGKGYHTYAPAQAETNYDLIAFTFEGTGAVTVTVQVYTLPTTGILAPATADRTLVVDAAGLADANVVKLGPTGSGTAQTARDIGASVLLSSGTGTGQLDFTSGVVKANVTQLLGTAWLTPGTAGTPDVNVKLWNALTTVALPLVPTTAGRTLDVSVGGEAGIDWANVGSQSTSVNLSATTINLVNTATTVTNQLTAAAIATGVWQDATAGDFTTASSIGKALYIANIAPGASGGHMISGSNAGTTTLGALTVTGATTLTGAVTGTNASNDLRVNTTQLGGSTTPVTNIGTVFNTDFASNYNTTLDAWNVNTTTLNGQNVSASSAVDFDTLANLDAAVTTRMATYTQPTGFLAATFPTTIASTTNITAGTITTATNVTTVNGIAANAITASALATDAVAEIADGVWDEALSGHLTAGSTGNALNAAGSAGDPWSTSLPGAYGAGSAGYIIGTNLNATISSRSSHSAADVWAAGTRTLTAFDEDSVTIDLDATIRAALGMASANLDTQLTAIDDYLDTELAAVKTKTDYLPSATAGSAGGLFIAGSNAATTVNITGNITGNLSGSVNSVTTAVAITSNIKKNQALAGFQFMMTDSTDHEPATGKTVTCTRSIDGGAFASGTLANVTEVSNGMYTVDFGAGDLNGNVIVLRATATDCDDTFERIITQP